MSNSTPSPIDWSGYRPTDRATLLFCFRTVGTSNQVLLIRKKRGLGAGKINAPGGRIEKGETLEQAAIRECHEEVGVVAHRVHQAGTLAFQFLDGYALHCTVFVSHDFSGHAIETDEAVPIWTDAEALPFDEMWEDDQHWIPLMLAGRRFSGRFVFEGDRMTWMDLRADAKGPAA